MEDERSPSAALEEIRAAEVVLPCSELDWTLEFFVERLGFRLDAIFPADDPAVAIVSGHGVRLRLERGAKGDPGVLRIRCREAAAIADGAFELRAPNGTRIELVDADPPLVLPALRPSFVVSKLADALWVQGRAGMRYRDLIPDRQGGRFVASHIEISGGGPVPDYVHFHRIHFQMIYCHRGWVRVVYEDQGPPFLLRAGDCVLQPPQIRHRVLESSPGLQVIEVGCPAEHETLVDHELALPTSRVAPERELEGQRFVRHRGEGATWKPWRVNGFEARDTGIAEATRGIASVQVVRPRDTARSPTLRHDAELMFMFVLEGSTTLESEDRGVHPLEAGDAFVVPAGSRFALGACSENFELLEVTLPGTAEIGLAPPLA